MANVPRFAVLALTLSAIRPRIALLRRQHLFDNGLYLVHLVGGRVAGREVSRDGDGGQLIAQLVSSSPQTVVVVATIHDDDAHVFPALRAGASGYILKSQPAEVVRAQLRRIEQGEPALSPSIAARVLRHFRVGAERSTEPASAPAAALPSVQLTDREVDVLRLIAKGYKASEVAQLLSLSSHTVTTYVRDIYRKLGISSRAEATLEAARRGLVT